MTLTEIEARHAPIREKGYRLSDGGGLYLAVRPGGQKVWQLRRRGACADTLLELGEYPQTTLAAARAMRLHVLEAIAKGKDPKLELMLERNSALLSFEAVARTWYGKKLGVLRPSYAKSLWARLERDAFPSLGSHNIREITAPMVLRAIKAVEERGSLTVSVCLKGEISRIFRFAMANSWVDHDPTLMLSAALSPAPRVQHRAHISFSELPDFLKKLGQYVVVKGPRHQSEITKSALIFILLTWARSNEARRATWQEFENLEGREPLWRIPPERMKMGKEHLVPLSRQAADLLLTLQSKTKSLFVFPGQKEGRPISRNTMMAACYRLGYGRRQTVHGFRGLAATWANESEYFHTDWIEAALAHALPGIRGIYNSAIYLRQRRMMLQTWADAIFGQGLDPMNSGTRRVSLRPMLIGSDGLPAALPRTKVTYRFPNWAPIALPGVPK